MTANQYMFNRKILNTAKALSSLFDWRETSVAVAFCPICHRHRVFVKLRNYEMAVRCVTCRASAVSLSIVSVIRKLLPKIDQIEAYEISSRGPLLNWLRANVKSLVCSEFVPGRKLGEFHNGIRCEDIQELTFEGNNFDLVTSTEVLEHVPNDAKAFAEIHRVLRPNGLFAFTVPLRLEMQTIERATVNDEGTITHHQPPEYHGDPISPSGRILAFRTYGRDIVHRLEAAGFIGVQIVKPVDEIPWNFSRPVVVAWKSIEWMSTWSKSR